MTPPEQAAPSELDKADATAFERWWSASKYCQVAFGQNKQVAMDGWNAALIYAQQILIEHNAALAAQAPPQCISYPHCDGDLEGIDHIPPCPLAAQAPQMDAAKVIAPPAVAQERVKTNWQKKYYAMRREVRRVNKGVEMLSKVCQLHVANFLLIRTNIEKADAYARGKADAAAPSGEERT